MRVVLLGDLGELLEADAVVLVRVLHARLREHAGHQAGAEQTLDLHHRAVAATRLVDLAAAVTLAARAEQAALAHLLDTDRETHVGFAGLDREQHRAQRGRAGRARVGDVVDGDAGLADLLLQLLADAGLRVEEAAARRSRPCRGS